MDMSPFQRFIYTSKYSKWIEEKGRRENWGETVDRWWGWMREQAPQLDGRPDIREAVYNLEVMPSMRALMTAGPAADRTIRVFITAPTWSSIRPSPWLSCCTF
jgi:ribonucleoside-triphosphate reductase